MRHRKRTIDELLDKLCNYNLRLGVKFGLYKDKYQLYKDIHYIDEKTARLKYTIDLILNILKSMM